MENTYTHNGPPPAFWETNPTLAQQLFGDEPELQNTDDNTAASAFAPVFFKVLLCLSVLGMGFIQLVIS